MQIRVPVDDSHTNVMFYTVHAPEGAPEPGGNRCVDYPIEWVGDDGRYIVDYIEGQDIMAWVSQGPVADRVNERITKSDVGVIACRRMFRDAIEAVRAGKDPIAVVREPHDVIKLPLERSKFGRGAAFATDWINDGSMRYSPLAAELKQLHIDAAAAREKLAAT
jgi:5,5'-dehydrodivanillate O-demethylase